MAAVVGSALRRAITFANPLAYWPMEDGSDTPVPVGVGQTGRAVIVSPGPAPAATSLVPAGSASAWTFGSGGSMSFPTGQAAGAAPDGWEFEFTGGWSTLPTVADGTFVIVAYGLSSGPGIYSGVGIGNSSGVYYWVKYQIESGGGAVFNYLVELASPQAGRTYHVRVRGIQAVPNMRIGISVDGVDASPLGFAGTLQMPTAVVVNAAAEGFAASNIESFSHLAFWTPYRATATTYLAADGHVGEQAHVRVARLCAEAGVVVDVNAPGGSQPMGAQPPDGLWALLRECEDADVGHFVERRSGVLGFDGHTARENQPVALALDYTRGHIAPPLEPTDDDLLTLNDVTIIRRNGGEGRFVDQTGPLGVDNIGRHDAEFTLNLYADAGTIDLPSALTRGDLHAALLDVRAVPAQTPWSICRHEAGHALVCLMLGAVFDGVAVDPGRSGHVGAVAELTVAGRWPAAAALWGGLLAEGHAGYAGGDLAKLDRLGFARQCGPGSPFAYAEDVVRYHAGTIDVLAAALADRGTLTYDEVCAIADVQLCPPDRSHRRAELLAELYAVERGERRRPAPDTPRHEAGHVLAALCLGVHFLRVTARPVACHAAPGAAGHVCGLVDCGPLVTAAYSWAGGVAEGTFTGAVDDLDAIHADGLAGWAGAGSPFAVACAVVGEHAELLDVLAAALAEHGELSYEQCREIAPWHIHADWPDWVS